MRKQKQGKTKKRFFLIILLIVVIVILIGVLLLLGLRKSNRKEGEAGFVFGGENVNMEIQGNMVSAYGVTNIGVTEVEFPIDNLEHQLEVEAIYVSSGDTLEQGAAMFRFTEESVEEIREELQEKLRTVELEYRAGYIEYEQSKITAYYEREEALLSGKQAQEVYDETIAGLYSNVEKAEEELAEAKEQIAAYETAIQNNSYYTDYQVEYYKSLYDENLAILKARIDEWGVTWQEVTMGGRQSTADLHGQYVMVLSALYKILEQNLADYEQAVELYEDAVANADINLQTLKLQLSSLEEKYAEAKENYETSILQAKLTKETTLSNAEKAESIYETDMEKAESDYEALEDAKKEAESNLEIFETYIRDNCYYAEAAGSVLRINVRSGDLLGSDSRLYTLSNKDEITVTVSVNQEDIAKLQVGDLAMVQSTESGTYEGTVISINPISSSTGTSGITYSVTVQLTGERIDLGANETVIVYFGLENGAVENE